MEKLDIGKAEKGAVSVRQRGNSYEARIRLELKIEMEGEEKNPRLSRSGQTKECARERLANLIVEKFFIKHEDNIKDGIFTSECEENLKGFIEYQKAKENFILYHTTRSTMGFYDFSIVWLNYKKEYINPNTGKKLSGSTIDGYVHLLKSHIKTNFEKYSVEQMTKEIIENYIDKVRKEHPRTAKDVFLMIQQILKYAVKKELIGRVPDFEVKFPRKKRSKKTKLVYLPAERQKVWLDYLEKDGRGFCKLFATLLQTGMRPEEGCGLLLSNILFDKDMIYVGNAHKDETIYDYNFNIIGHNYIDDELKTDESYREIPLNNRLKSMLLNIYNERKQKRKSENIKFDPSKEYAFLNTKGTPYLSQRLDKKIKSFIHKYKLEHMTVYGLRHSFATLMSENGMDKEVLREIMGHVDFETTEFYYIYISEKRKKDEFKKANDKSFADENILENKDIQLKQKRFIRKKIKAPMRISA